MRKKFISPETVRNNAFRLAAKIHTEGFFPDVIYIALRGGASMGNPMSEFFKRKQKQEKGRRRVLFAAVTARSYTGIGEREEVRVEGWTYNPEHLRADDRVLLVDDVFDRGLTVNHLAGVITGKGIPREHLKVAVHDYKYRTFLKEHLPVQPDYWCERHEINTEEEDPWLHYLSHELDGLTKAEMLEHLCPDDPELVHMLLSV